MFISNYSIDITISQKAVIDRWLFVVYNIITHTLKYTSAIVIFNDQLNIISSFQLKIVITRWCVYIFMAYFIINSLYPNMLPPWQGVLFLNVAKQFVTLSCTHFIKTEIYLYIRYQLIVIMIDIYWWWLCFS